jgi:hypothetical protein
MTRKSKQPMPPRPRLAAPAAPATPVLTSEQMARLLLADANSSAALDSEIALQRQVNQRLLALWDSLEGAPDAEDETGPALQVKVAAALTTGTGRVAHLLRDQRALTGQAADGLTAAIAQALDELTTELGVAL